MERKRARSMVMGIIMNLEAAVWVHHDGEERTGELWGGTGHLRTMTGWGTGRTGDKGGGRGGEKSGRRRGSLDLRGNY